jgi:hypothetical protein
MSKRLSLSLEWDDETSVAPFIEEGTPERNALVHWAMENGIGPGRLRSEAALYRVLLRAGAESLREQALAEGYAELAASYTSDEDQAEVRAQRQRYAKRVDRVSPA